MVRITGHLNFALGKNKTGPQTQGEMWVCNNTKSWADTGRPKNHPQQPARRGRKTPGHSALPWDRGSYLSKPLQMYDQHVRQSPEAQRNAALLQLLTVWAPPGVIRGELETRSTTLLALLKTGPLQEIALCPHFWSKAWLNSESLHKLRLTGVNGKTQSKG